MQDYEIQDQNDRLFTERWIKKQLRYLALHATRKNVDPCDIVAFSHFLRTSKDDSINWAGSIVEAFSGWAGPNYKEFVRYAMCRD